MALLRNETFYNIKSLDPLIEEFCPLQTVNLPFGFEAIVEKVGSVSNLDGEGTPEG